MKLSNLLWVDEELNRYGPVTDDVLKRNLLLRNEEYTMDRHYYVQKLNESGLDERPPFGFITSRELAKALGVHIQTLSNWRLRGVGPTAAPQNWFKGRASRYNVGHVLAWAHEQAGQVVAPWQFNADWLRTYMGGGDWSDPEKVQHQVSLMIRLAREFRPAELTRYGRAGLGI